MSMSGVDVLTFHPYFSLPRVYGGHGNHGWHCLVSGDSSEMGSRDEDVKNEDIRGTARAKGLEGRVREARTKWFGHIKHMDNKCVGRRMLEMKLPGRQEQISGCGERGVGWCDRGRCREKGKMEIE